jgi:hypothetical protein
LRLRVVGMGEGMETAPEHATCLRDVLEGVAFSFVGRTEEVDPSSYRLWLQIQSTVRAPERLNGVEDQP